MKEESTKGGNWELYYHHFLNGRSAYIRLIFEELGIPYEDMVKTREDIMKFFYSDEKLANTGFPVLHPPVIKNGNFQLGQTAVVCRYLGEKYGLVPEKEEDKWHAEMLNAEIHDFLGQGVTAFHGKDYSASYLSQKKETQPYITWFAEERIPKYLKYFESVLKHNNGGQGFLFGKKLTYVDLAMFWILKATEASFGELWKNADYCPLLKAYRYRIEQRPNISAYLKSERFRPLENDSML